MFRFRGFTSCANDAVNLALSQACLLGHTYIGSEHLLLGLLLEGSTGSSLRCTSAESMPKPYWNN